MNTGISVVICTHNGAERIPETVKCIMAQKTDSFNFEVIIVDNVSTDNLASVVTSDWNIDIPIRIVREKKIGVGYARQTGIVAAKYDIVCFVDDDNHLEDDYLKIAFHFFEKHPMAGAIGGLCLPPSQAKEVFWFDRYQSYYAVGPQAKEGGKLEWHYATLWTAGMCIRKTAWKEILKNDFQMMMVGRVGKKLLSGEDNEICYLLRLFGYELYYVPEMQLVHNISPEKLNWKHCCKLKRGFGSTSVYLSIYRNMLAIKFLGKSLQRKHWIKEILITLWKIISKPLDFAATICNLFEGNNRILNMHAYFGDLQTRLTLLWRLENIRVELNKKYQHLL